MGGFYFVRAYNEIKYIVRPFCLSGTMLRVLLGQGGDHKSYTHTHTHTHTHVCRLVFLCLPGSQTNQTLPHGLRYGMTVQIPID